MFIDSIKSSGVSMHADIDTTGSTGEDLTLLDPFPVLAKGKTPRGTSEYTVNAAQELSVSTKRLRDSLRIVKGSCPTHDVPNEGPSCAFSSCAGRLCAPGLEPPCPGDNLPTGTKNSSLTSKRFREKRRRIDNLTFVNSGDSKSNQTSPQCDKVINVRAAFVSANAEDVPT